jgi:hypothetical protein
LASIFLKSRLFLGSFADERADDCCSSIEQNVGGETERRDGAWIQTSETGFHCAVRFYRYLQR